VETASHDTITSMRLVSWNVNGIRAVHKKGEFIPFVKKLAPDIICLQETKAAQGQAEIDLPDYTEYWNSAEKKGYSGTAIFTKLKPLAVINGFPQTILEKYDLKDTYGDPNTEGRIIAAEYKDFFVVNSYTPNSKPDLSRLTLRHTQWDPAFLAYCKALERKKPVIFCGDLNVAHTEEDLANPEANEGEHGFTEEEREGIDEILAEGFVDTFRHFTPEGKGHYTWWSAFSGARSRNTGWRIDYIFVSKKLVPRLKSASIYADIYGSDHCPISITIS